jgi:hypothetical protein
MGTRAPRHSASLREQNKTPRAGGGSCVRCPESGPPGVWIDRIGTDALLNQALPRFSTRSGLLRGLPAGAALQRVDRRREQNRHEQHRTPPRSDPCVSPRSRGTRLSREGVAHPACQPETNAQEILTRTQHTKGMGVRNLIIERKTPRPATLNQAGVVWGFHIARGLAELLTLAQRTRPV